MEYEFTVILPDKSGKKTNALVSQVWKQIEQA